MQKGIRVLDRFRVEDRIGEGAAGVVHRAVDDTGRSIALKVLRPVGVDRSAPERFAREALALASLEDEAVVRYVAHGALPSGDLVLAMEWVEGGTLAGRLARGRLGLAETLRLARRLARALSVVHGAGIVHRDVKPSNVLLPDGALDGAKLADFGLARGAADPTMTGSSALLGTPRYLAPEQVRGARHVDGRADLFSLGCVLYECLAGVPAFGADDAMAILVQILFEPIPSLATARPDLPPAVCALVDALLRRDRDERPEDARAIARLLDDLEAEPLSIATPPAPALDHAVLRRVSAALPMPPSPLLGREADLVRVEEALRRGPVALWGAPGIGKTRVAVELARVAAQAGRAAFFVDASGAADDDALLASTARALGLPLASPTWESIADVLRAHGEPSLVWDAIDDVAATASTRGAWLHDAAPAVRVVTTSRRRPPSGACIELAGLPEDAAIALLSRATAREPDADRPSRTLAVEIANALDRVPLALELAAARIDLLGLEGVHARRASPLTLLGGPRGDALESALEWSFARLDDAARRACTRLSVFVDAFDVAAAEAVLGVDLGPPLALLERLRGESLLVRAGFAREPPGAPRLRMPAVIRAYVRDRDARPDSAAAHVTQADLTQARAARRAHFSARGRSLARELDRSGSAEALASLLDDADELHAALRDASSEHDAEAAVTLALALEPVLSARGATPTWLGLLDGACALSTAPEHLRDEARLARARALGTAGRPERGIAELEALLSTTSSDAHRARVLLELSVLRHAAQRLEEARTGYAQAAELLAHLGEDRAEARAEANLGAVAHDLGDHEAARAHYEAALSLLRSVGDRRLRGITLSNLALLLQEHGEREPARRCFEEAVAHVEAFGDVRLLGVVLGNLGMLELEQRASETAKRHLLRAHDVLASTGDTRSIAIALARLGMLAADRGELGEAEARYVRAERLAARLDAPLRETVHLARAFADLTRAEAAWLRGAEDGATAHLARARERVARAEGWHGRVAWARTADDLRTALRILRPKLEALAMFVPP